MQFHVQAENISTNMKVQIDLPYRNSVPQKS